MEALSLFIVIPFMAAFLIVLSSSIWRKYLPDIIANISSVSTAVLAVMVFAKVASKPSVILIHKIGGWAPPFGIPIIADGLSAFLLAIANLVSLAVIIYSVGYINTYTDKWKYYALLMLMMGGVNGVLLTGDIFNLFVFLEIASIATYTLVAFGTEAEAFEASFKYAIMSAVASSFILIGIIFIYGYTSTLNMADMAMVFRSAGHVDLVKFVAVLFLMGFGLKTAAVPFHGWLPDSYTKAPATIPAMSSGVLLKTLGIYVICRIFFNVLGMSLSISYVLIGLGVSSMIVGAIMAFGQTNMRRLLGYSSISQVGYILLGFGIGTPLAIAGSLFHILNHSFAKSLLFLNSGDIEQGRALSTERVFGIIDQRPICGYTGLLAAMSICGIPPLAGFWSKLIIIFACIQSGHPILMVIAAAVSIVTLAYYLKFFNPLLFGTKKNILSDGQSFAVNLAMVILALGVLFGGLVWLPGPRSFIINTAVNVMTGGLAYADIVFGAIK